MYLLNLQTRVNLFWKKSRPINWASQMFLLYFDVTNGSNRLIKYCLKILCWSKTTIFSHHIDKWLIENIERFVKCMDLFYWLIMIFLGLSYACIVLVLVQSFFISCSSTLLEGSRHDGSLQKDLLTPLWSARCSRVKEVR